MHNLKLHKSTLLDSINKYPNNIVDNPFDNFYKPPIFKLTSNDQARR